MVIAFTSTAEYGFAPYVVSTNDGLRPRFTGSTLRRARADIARRKRKPQPPASAGGGA